MQSMIRRALVALVAVLAVGVVASASASAATCTGTVEKGAISLCVEGKEQLTETAFTVQKAPSTQMSFEVQDWGEDVCYSDTGKGAFNPSKSKLEIKGTVIKFPECNWYAGSGGANCTTGALIIDGGEGNGTGPGVNGTVKSTSEVLLGEGHRFTTIIIKSQGGVCEAAGKFQISGIEKCELQGSTVEAVEHTLYCPPEGGLYYYGTPALLNMTQEVTLASGKKWSLYKA